MLSQNCHQIFIALMGINVGCIGEHIIFGLKFCLNKNMLQYDAFMVLKKVFKIIKKFTICVNKNIGNQM